MSKSSLIRSVSKVLPIALAVLLLSVSIKTIIHEFKDHSWQSIWQYLQTISNTRKMASVALTGLGYLAMTGYDILGFQYINQVLAPAKIAGTAFISYAVGNTIGFSAFSGTAIRYHFYSSWGVSKLKIAQLIVFTHLTFWLGLFGVSGVVFLVDPLTLPKVLKLPFNSVHPIGFIFLALVAIYFVIGYFWNSSLRIGSEEIVFPSSEMSLQLIGLAAVDWGLACGVLYLLLPLDHSMSYPGFFGIYILALTAGLMSTVPGGLGVFDTVILLLRPDSISAPDILGALIAYRIIYYILPLIMALGLFMIQHFQRTKG